MTLEILRSCKNSEFREFLLGLSKYTLDDFTHFGKISKNNVDKIIRSELNNDNKIRFFTYNNSELIGYSFLLKFSRPSKKHVCSYGIVISDRWQGVGFGYKICNHMIKDAWKRGYEKIWLTTYFDNKPAFKIYKKLGFLVEGVFINEEKINGKSRHVISMGLFRNKKHVVKTRQKILKKIN